MAKLHWRGGRYLTAEAMVEKMARGGETALSSTVVPTVVPSVVVAMGAPFENVKSVVAPFRVATAPEKPPL